MDGNINQIIDDIEDGNFTDGDNSSDDESVDFTTLLDVQGNHQSAQENTTSNGQSSPLITMLEQEVQDLYDQVIADEVLIENMQVDLAQQEEDVRESRQRSEEVIVLSQRIIQDQLRSRYSAAQCIIETGVFLNMLTMGSAILINIYPQLALSLGGITVFNCVLPLLSLGLAFLLLGMLILGLANQAARAQNMPPISTYQIMTNHLSTLFAHRNARADSGNNIDRNELRI